MKRFPTLLLPTLLIAVLLSLEVTHVRAQTTLSLTGGVNRTSLNVDADGAFSPDFESLTRTSVGLAATIPVSDRFGLQLGGRYAQKGGRLDVIGVLEMGDMMGGLDDIPSGTSLHADIKMDYVELTVLARVGFPLSGDRVSGHLLAGPALGLRSSCELGFSVSGPDVPAVDVDSEELEFDFRPLDFGLAAGAGIDIGLTDSIDAHLGLLYTLGFADISEDVDDSTKHRALTIQAGLAMPIG